MWRCVCKQNGQVIHVKEEPYHRIVRERERAAEDAGKWMAAVSKCRGPLVHVHTCHTTSTAARRVVAVEVV